MIGSKKRAGNAGFTNQVEYLLTDTVPFAIQEAYKMIRTNIIFSIPDQKCKKILVTSALQGEAKSTTAVNVSIAFAQNQSRILLVDCDLRLPTDAKKLNAQQSPGLTNLLVGMCTLDEAIQQLPSGLDVLAAGDIPPNPSELLGSPRMEQLMKELESRYEYIILDTPPICAVADATILSKMASGVILVVRQGIATRENVNNALEKLKVANAKVLGIVMTGAANEKTKSYSKGKGYGYGYGYADNYAKAQMQIGDQKNESH
ncbi:CpsD/CapB family tyrosine-protein kinase [Butyricicoccus porcorum]